MGIKVSIIIATLNAENTLEEALNSVVMQSYQDWECVVIDGASQDNTLGIVLRYVTLDSRIRYISEPDKGVYDALNKGLKMAKGEWIHCLGSDDKLTKNGISDLMTKADGHDVVCGNTYIVFPNGKTKIQNSKGVSGCHQSMIIRKSVIEALNGFDLSYRIIADHKMLRQIEQDNFRICKVDSCISYFSMGGMSQSLRFQFTICKETYRIGKECGDRHPLFTAIRIMLFKIGSIIKRRFI